MLLDYFDRYARTHRPYKGGAWCYEDGLVYRGLAALHRATGDDRWLAHVERLVAAQLGADGTLAGYSPSEYNIDNILSGRALIDLHHQTGEPRYLSGARALIDQLRTHPRTQSGVYWHKLRYPWQVWLDGLYMGLPFQIEFAQATGDDALISDAMDQLSTALEMSYVPETGLYAHATDEARMQDWADPVTGHSKAHWARALGWLAMALVDIAALVGPERFAPIAPRAETFLDSIARMRRPDGLWLQVIDQPDLAGNYEESSASAMFVYALLRAKALGLYAGETASLTDLLMTKALSGADSPDPRMIRICHVAGLGPYNGRYRDGSAAYYVSETLADDDPKGVGPLMSVVALGSGTADARPLVAAGA